MKITKPTKMIREIHTLALPLSSALGLEEHCASAFRVVPAIWRNMRTALKLSVTSPGWENDCPVSRHRAQNQLRDPGNCLRLNVGLPNFMFRIEFLNTSAELHCGCRQHRLMTSVAAGLAMNQLRFTSSRFAMKRVTPVLRTRHPSWGPRERGGRPRHWVVMCPAVLVQGCDGAWPQCTARCIIEP